ncbi:inner membrane-spanning protein YciB [Altererythrobacter sp. TH136]|uniref:inner membrane-spanning protein YciB n=1 Tax=Altererythrobacter sp. TH136 TaxID=2067415 RepID=UPI0011629DAE|nr:inner membrane-spanning protein YciB [Altererythrobacter sp. TH136]QDM40431.1 septation protein IspZ [Altererythrobacter sp. TH136]
MNDGRQKPSGWLNVLVDYGPLIVFLAVFKLSDPGGDDIGGTIAAIIRGTGAFIVAAIAALIFSRVKFGRVSPMLWLSTGLIIGFGGLTIFLGEPFWVQIKPTVIYLLFAAALLIGYARGAALLEVLLAAAFEGVDRAGWLKLSRNWGLFFLFLAALNEALRYFYNAENGGFETWLWAKLWVFMPLSFLFTFTQIPMLLRHGLSFEDRDEVLKDQPPTD